jgi:trimeric autotransporter adhesin
VTAIAAPQAQGGTIRGTVVSGTAGKPGGIPLPGVAVTATNTLTGRRYTTATDINGAYAMTIPKNGRYVVRAELAGFALVTQEVLLNGSDATAGAALVKTSNFGLQLASRAAEAEARAAAVAGTTGAERGVQSLNLSAGAADTTDASSNASVAGGDVTMPSLAGLNDTSGGQAAASGSESIAVSGQVGQTNGLANYSEDEIRERVEDAVARARANGQLPPGGGDPTNAIVSMLGGMMAGGGPGGGGIGGGRGGGGGARGGFGGGAFRNFNPAQPHGNIFYQGGNAALNASTWIANTTNAPHFTPNPSAFSNRFGVNLAGSPYIPGLFKPNTKQFGFLNITGQKNLNAFAPNPVRVPTLLERAGDFSQSEQQVGAGNPTPVMLYDPKTGQPIPGNNLANATVPISPQALALLNYYPAPNLAVPADDPTAPNYQTISNAGSNNIAVNTRFIRTIGQAVGGPFGRFGGGGGRRSGTNAKPTLRQNINLGFNYSHSATDQRNIFLPLGGATSNNGYALNAGYTIGYGRFSNNASLNWNRLAAETHNYFTNTSNNPTAVAGIDVPNQTGGFADPSFYNGLPTVTITNFASLTNTSPNEAINQTISFSDFVSWRHAKHNLRLGVDVRRVHADSIGGSSPLGSFSFTGFATESESDKSNSNPQTGSGFADFLLGLPQTTSIQAGLYKSYLRANVLDGYATDDFRLLSNVTLNYGVRWEYFSPYVEKNNRLVNLDHNADFTEVDPVQPGGTGAYGGGYPRSLVNPDRAMFAPRMGVAWRPKSNSSWWKDTVVRAGYGINYNTGQYATFAKQLSFQPPFAETQTNDVPIATLSNPNPTPTGCMTTTPETTANMTLANGFGCSTEVSVLNNYSVNKNYRLGMVQVYNLNVQRTIPLQIVLNIGYSGSKGSNLDVVGSPNSSTSGSTIPGVAPFSYETSQAGSHSNSLVVSAQKRQQKGIALGIIYTYGHSIDNASSIGGTSATTVQDFRRLDLEEGNSSFDTRQSATGNWVLELPFGPNRAFLNRGGAWSHALDGFSLSGSFTFATGTYYTPSYSGNKAEAASGNLFTQRPDRVFTESITGPGTLKDFFNTNAFVAPAAEYGTASRNSIEGPGTVLVSAALSRTVQLGETRSFEARVTAANVFNTVQYSGINTQLSSANYGQVTNAAAMRAVTVMARYRF